MSAPRRAARHEFVHNAGPLDPSGTRIVDGRVQARWLCSCGATGNWVDDPHPDDLTDLHAEHRKRVGARS